MLGMRREELSKLKYEDYDESTQSTKISGKKKKGRPNFLTGNVLVAFNDWITVRGKTSGPLSNLINKSNNMLRIDIAPTEIFIIVNRRMKQTGVDKFSPHDLRRSLIGDMIDMGIDLVVISRLIGHSSINTAVGYDCRPDTRVRDALGKISVSRCV